MFKRLIAIVTILVAFGLITVTDSSAQSVGLRKFYLSRAQVDGAHTFHVCVPGFHFASMWEILNPTTLVYDVEDGATNGDAGSGPPSDMDGWIRNGGASSGVAGPGNCRAWTSNGTLFPSDVGSIVDLTGPAGWTLAAKIISPWGWGDVLCSNTVRVWCVEDEP
jgi:hypothetical protein